MFVGTSLKLALAVAEFLLGLAEELGEDFKSKVNEEFNYIKQYPKHYQKKYEELRQAIVTRFPYTVYYLIEEELKMIVVIGVLAQKQNFDRIIKRIKK